MHLTITLTEEEAVAFDTEALNWADYRRAYQLRGLVALKGATGSVDFVHPDGTLIDWIRSNPACDSFEEF